MPKKFKQLADEYFANRYQDNPEESGVDSGALAQSLVSLERDEDLSDRVDDLLVTDEASPPVEVDVDGAAPDTFPLQEASHEIPEPNVKSTEPEVDEPRIERPPAPSVPTPGRGIVQEGMQEFEPPDVRLESSADIEANFAPGIQSTTILPKDADFDAQGLLAEVEKRVVVTPDSASPILAGVPELEPMPDVNAIIKSVGDQHIAAYSDQVASWERR